MNKQPKKPIVFKSCQGMFGHTLLEAETMAKKFRGTNIDWALHKGIEDGWLFVMPKGLKFAYCRGSGPVCFNGVRLGHHENKQKDSDTPDWSSPRLLVATYRLTLFDEEESEDKQVTIDIPIPSRFTDFYVERSEEIAHNPKLTKLEFKYNTNELRVWMRDVQARKYGEAERECHQAIRDLKERIIDIQNMGSGVTKVPYQSAFG
jgi:hypothetical protein